MAKLVHRIDAGHITLKIKVPVAFGFRVWLMGKLLRLASMVSPVKIEVVSG